jgi:hypothetical protein
MTGRNVNRLPGTLLRCPPKGGCLVLPPPVGS